MGNTLVHSPDWLISDGRLFNKKAFHDLEEHQQDREVPLEETEYPKPTWHFRMMFAKPET